MEAAPFREGQVQSLFQWRAGLKPAPTVGWSVDRYRRSAGTAGVGAGSNPPFTEQGISPSLADSEGTTYTLTRIGWSELLMESAACGPKEQVPRVTEEPENICAPPRKSWSWRPGKEKL